MISINSVFRIATVLMLTTALTTAAQAAERLQLPDKLSVANANTLGSRDTIESRDEIIVGDVVNIDHYLRTNGGNVLIVADKLVISAPIDTRVRFPISRLSSDQPSLDSQLPLDSRERRSFDAMYFWSDVWDPTLRRFTYKPLTASEINQAGSEGIAMLPPGLVAPGRIGLPYWDNKPIDGATAPVVDRNFYRSESITIYAREISFCDDCKRKQVDEPAVPDGDPLDRQEARYLVVAGAKGGRAGLGSPFPCNYDWIPVPTQSGFSIPACNEEINGHGTADSKAGGVSGTPSRGGPAGDITITFVSNAAGLASAIQDQQAFEKALRACTGLPQGNSGTRSSACDLDGRTGRALAALSDVRGGPPPVLARLQTPAESQLTGSRADFHSVSGSTPLPVADFIGETGSFSIRGLSANQALTEIAAHLTAFDARKHDIQLVLSRLREINPDDQLVPSLVARDLLDDFINTSLSHRQLGLLAAAELWSARKSETAATPDFFSSLSCNVTASAVLLDNEKEDAHRICEFSPVKGRAPLNSYLLSTNGLLAIPDSLAAPDIQAARMLAAITSVDMSIKQVIATGQRIESLVFERFTAQEAAEFTARLNALQSALQAAQQKLAAEQDTTGKLFAAVKSCGEAVGAVAAAYTSGNYVGAASGLPNAVKTSGSVLAILNNEDTTQSAKGEVAKAKAELGAVQSAFEQFIERTNAYREEVSHRATNVARQMLDNRRIAINQQRAFSADFEALLKYGLINYAATPANNNGALLTPVRAIRAAITSWPNPLVQAYPIRPADRCIGIAPVPLDAIASSTILTCAVVSSGSRTVLQSAGRHTKVPSLPLLVVGQSRGNFSVNYGGFLRRTDILSSNIATPTTLMK